MSTSARAVTRVAILLLIPVIALAIIALVNRYSPDCPAVMRDILDLTICDTAYAKDFSVPAFGEIGSGDTLASVIDLIGEPFTEHRDYAYRWGYRDVGAGTISVAFDRNDAVLSFLITPTDDDTRKQISEEIRYLSTSAEVKRAYGKPSWEEAGSDSLYLHYSRSSSSTHYWHYSVVLNPYPNSVLGTAVEFYSDLR